MAQKFHLNEARYVDDNLLQTTKMEQVNLIIKIIFEPIKLTRILGTSAH